MDMLIAQDELYLSKLSAKQFGPHLSMRIAEQNMLKRIPIAMQNENKADCNAMRTSGYVQRNLSQLCTSGTHQ